jgi:hypothetical protein
MEADMAWLLQQIPGRDTLGLEATKAAQVIDILRRRDRKTLPVTIGLFGTWGSGKTTTLAYVAQQLGRDGDRSPFTVLYFNAWKYAGFMEAVPALIYKVLMAANVDANEPVEKVLGQIILGLGKKYAEGLGEWTKMLTGSDLVKVARDVVDVRNIVEEAAHPVAAAAKQYYTQLDRAQDLLAASCRKSARVIVALIDELDRCDPGEAFEIIKELRVFFTMRSVPIVFVLSVNPDPIGQAIKHQFGLASEWGDYEARRILEKFVDHYVEMDDSASIVAYVRSLWEGAGLDIAAECFVARADAALERPAFGYDTVKNASFDECMLADNPVYANRRLLAKSLGRVKRRETDVPWTAWHLEVADLAYPALRALMGRLAVPLVAVAEAAHRSLAEELRRRGCLGNDGAVVRGSRLQTDKGNAAFAVYRSLFWEGLRAQLETLAAKGDDQARRLGADLATLLADYRKVDFVATALMQPFRRQPGGGGHDVFASGHLGWVLSNY